MWQQSQEILEQIHNVVITTHVNPDGDGCGAASALMELLKLQGKQVRFICDSPIPEKFRFLDPTHSFEAYSPDLDLSDVDALIVLDTHRRERIGRLVKLLENNHLVSICIDHHEVTETFTHHTFIDAEACSVGAMIFDLFQEQSVPLSEKAALGIYTSVVCDTGRFSYSSTNEDAHRIAEHCLKLGVDPDFVYRSIYQQISFDEARMFAAALQNLDLRHDGRVVYQAVSQSDCKGDSNMASNLEHLDLEYMLEFCKMIQGVECVVLLREISQNVVRVSLRSKSSIDVGLLMRSIGGGGHSRAAGALIVGSIQEASEQIESLLRAALPRLSAI